MQNLLHQITRNRFMIKGKSESQSLNTILVFDFFSMLSISKEFSKFLFQFPVFSLSIHSSFHFSLDFLFSNERHLAKSIDGLMLWHQRTFQQHKVEHTSLLSFWDASFPKLPPPSLATTLESLPQAYPPLSRDYMLEFLKTCSQHAFFSLCSS